MPQPFDLLRWSLSSDIYHYDAENCVRVLKLRNRDDVLCVKAQPSSLPLLFSSIWYQTDISPIFCWSVALLVSKGHQIHWQCVCFHQPNSISFIVIIYILLIFYCKWCFYFKMTWRKSEIYFFFLKVVAFLDKKIKP